MSDTFLRFGLWIVIGVLAFYIVGDSVGQENLILGELIKPAFVVKIGQFGIALIGLGIVTKVIEKLKPPPRARCQTCGRTIPKGDIYCGTHMRDVLEQEDLKRRTLNQRRPDV